MSDPPAQTEPEAAPTPEGEPAKRRRHWLVRLGLWTGVTLCFLLLAAGLWLYSILGKPISAPDWLRVDVSERINAELTGASLSFGDVSVVLEHDWVPRLALRNVEIRDARGEELARLLDVQGSLALRPLLRGEVQPSTIRLSGATVRLRRAADGRLGLAMGDNTETLQEASSFAGLIQEMDRVLLQPNFAALKRIEAESLTIQYEDARAGRAWTVDGGRIELVRDKDDLQLRADFVLLGGRGFATTLEANYDGRIGETDARFGASFSEMPARDIAGQTPALAWLTALDAPISGALRASLDEEGALGPLNATLQIGAGALQPTTATKPIPFNEARTYLTFDPATQTLAFDEIAVDSKWVSARAEGKAFLIGADAGGWPTELWTQFRLTGLSANPAELYKAPVDIESATMDARLRLDPFELTLGEISLVDQGQKLVLTGAAAAEPGGWSLALDGKMDGLAPARLLQLWPESVKENTRNWIASNVTKAELSGIQLAVRAQPEQKPNLFLGFDFDGLETRFIQQVPVIEAASGHGAIYDSRFVISANSGHVTAAQGGKVDISGTSFIIKDIRLRQSPTEVRLKTKSTLTAALSLLDSNPFNFLQKAGQPVTLAEGQAEADGLLEFILKKVVLPEDVIFDITAVAREVRSETLVKGRVLAAPRLDITARDGELRIGGDGRIGQVPVTGSWSTRIGPGSAGGKSTLSGQIELSERFADEFGIGLPPGSVSGVGQGDITIDFAKGQPGRFRLTSALAGLGLRLQPLGWALSRSARGTLDVAGTLGTPPDISTLKIDAGGLVADGSIKLKPSGQLERAGFSRVRVGSWLNAPVDLIGRGANVTPAVRVRGGTIDMRQTSVGGGGGESNSQGGPITLTLDKLIISDGITLSNFRGDIDMAGGANGKFTGQVNGGAPIIGTVVPHQGRSAFRIQSQDAGGVLKSAGLLKSARRGVMELVLFPATAKGSYNGKLTVQGLRLTGAPALAALLNALSVVGLLDQLNGDGILFNQVEADFQLNPDRVILEQGSAVGVSMGISMDGYYYTQSGQMDMQGVVSPLYLVNAIGGVFSRKGEGLVGFSYALTGPAANPQVTINPLSLLTPGMFRELFRRPPPEVQR